MAGRERLALLTTRLRARLCGADVRFGRRVQLSPRAVLAVGRGERLVVGDDCHIHYGAVLAPEGGWIEIGAHSSVNPYTVLYGHGGLRIGSYVRIAAHCTLVPANHVFADPERPIARQGLTREGIVIQDDVWIGANAVVVDGVTIGRGSVVAAGAVVTKDVPPFSVVAGCPARVVRRREAA